MRTPEPPRDLVLATVIALVASVAFFADSLPGEAHAELPGPIVSLGAHPWVTFTGNLAEYTEETLVTVPADQVFVLTSLCSADFEGLSLKESGTEKVPAGLIARCLPTDYKVGGLATGRAHVTFQPGSDVVLRHWGIQGAVASYYGEGYFANP